MPFGPGTYGPAVAQPSLARQLEEEQRKLAALRAGDTSQSPLLQQIQRMRGNVDPTTPEGFEQQRRGGLRAQMGGSSVPPNVIYEPWMGEEAGYGSLSEARQPGARHNFGFGNVPDEVRPARSVEDIMGAHQRNEMRRGLTPSQRRLLDASGKGGTPEVPGKAQSPLLQALMDRDAVRGGLDPSELPKREHSFDEERGLQDFQKIPGSNARLKPGTRTAAIPREEGEGHTLMGANFVSQFADPDLTHEDTREVINEARQRARLGLSGDEDLVKERLANRNRMEAKLQDRRKERAAERLKGAKRAAKLKAARDPLSGGGPTARAVGVARNYLQNTGDYQGAKALFNSMLGEGMAKMKSQDALALQGLQNQGQVASQQAKNEGFLNSALAQGIFGLAGPILSGITSEGGEWAGGDVIGERLGEFGSQLGNLFGGGGVGNTQSNNTELPMTPEGAKKATRSLERNHPIAFSLLEEAGVTSAKKAIDILEDQEIEVTPQLKRLVEVRYGGTKPPKQRREDNAPSIMERIAPDPDRPRYVPTKPIPAGATLGEGGLSRGMNQIMPISPRRIVDSLLGRG